LSTRVGLIQLCATPDVQANLATAEALARRAVTQGAEVVMLPEAFAQLGPPAERLAIAEPRPEGGPILERCRALARRLEAELLLGGFPERMAGERRTGNTAVHLDRQGQIVARYRKIHLFDVDLPDGTRLRESESTAPGEVGVLTPMPFGLCGLTICYDLRFPTLYEQLADGGAQALAVPSAFTATTGPLHWHTLLRARAVECQCWVLAPAQVGLHFGHRVSYGHTLAVDPWGRIHLDLGRRQGVGVVDVDPAAVAEVRSRLPSLANRRLERGQPR